MQLSLIAPKTHKSLHIYHAILSISLAATTIISKRTDAPRPCRADEDGSCVPPAGLSMILMIIIRYISAVLVWILTAIVVLGSLGEITSCQATKSWEVTSFVFVFIKRKTLCEDWVDGCLGLHFYQKVNNKFDIKALLSENQFYACLRT